MNRQRSRIPALMLALAAMLASSQAFAEKRVALVIGNAAYSHVPKLLNPAKDAEAVSLLLKSAGFAVVETRRDLGIAEMRRAIRDFSEMTQDADMAAVFYAGHGIEVDGANYLIPVDAKLERDVDIEDETISLERLLRILEPAKRLRLVILDACRENPFARTMKRTIASRSFGRGLARVEPVTADTLVAFAARAGSTAADGDGTHSPFTAALLRHLAKPGLDVRLAFGLVRDDVLKATGKRQEPFVYGSLGGDVVTLVSLPNEGLADTAAIARLADPNALAARDYEAAAKVGTKEAWDAFLAAHPKGFYGDLARAQRANLIDTVQNKRAPDKPVRQQDKTGPETKSIASQRTRSSASENYQCATRYYRRLGFHELQIPLARQNGLSTGTDFCRK